MSQGLLDHSTIVRWVEIAVQPVEALIDSGSSATVMTFSLFQRIARDAQLSVDVLGEAICHTERLNWSDV